MPDRFRHGIRSFPIQHGTCHLFQDRIEIERHDLLGRFTHGLYQRGFRQASFLYALLAAGFSLAGLVSALISNYFLALFFGVFAALALYTQRTRRNISFAPVISRDSIQEVRFLPAEAGLSRAAVEFWFMEGETRMRRRVSLPSLLHNGAEIADATYRLLREARLITSEP
ncbi:MAG: hypothetical protein SF053_14100 [Bacteroidia bacterium]|nr:hypothetical protein [Bacteroidia bacterium]